MDKLTIDHIESLAACADVEFVHVTSNPSTRIDVKRVLRQLADTMRENAELKAHPLKLICEKCGVLTDVEHANKDTNHNEDSLDMVGDAGNATKDTEENNG